MGSTSVKKLSKNDKAPDFVAQDCEDNQVQLASLRGKKILLSFYRYAGCPLSKLRLRELTNKYPYFNSRGLEIIGVFQSADESIRELARVQNTPITLIGDSQRDLYRLYGVETSWRGMLSSIADFQKLGEALLGGYLPGKIEGDFSRMPADFLIDENFNIHTAHYGRYAGDNIPLDRVDQFLA